MATAGVAGGRITAGVGANLIGQHAQDRNQEATVYVGNLDVQLSEETVWELFIQAGPLGDFTFLLIFKQWHLTKHFVSCAQMLLLSICVKVSWCAVNVYLPKDRVTSQHQGYGFVEFKSEEDADYVSFGASPAR
jgi:splicing factor 3B subunit 4